MPFTKETAKKCSELAHQAKKAKTEAWESIVFWLAGEGGSNYLTKLQELSNGAELTKPEMEFMDRYESLLEYHRPKLGRMEMSAKIDMGINPEQLNTIVDAYLSRGNRKSSNKKNL